jgi:hypothetical protein
MARRHRLPQTVGRHPTSVTNAQCFVINLSACAAGFVPGGQVRAELGEVLRTDFVGV